MAAIGTKKFDFDLTEAKVQIIGEYEARLARWKAHSEDLEARLRVESALVSRLRRDDRHHHWLLPDLAVESIANPKLRQAMKERLASLGDLPV